MTVIETFQKLKSIEKKIQEKVFVPETDKLFFSDWAITDYVFSILHTGTIEIENFTFQLSQTIPKDAKLCYLQSKKKKIPSEIYCIKSETIQKIPKLEMRSPLTSMGTIFAYLPNNLNNYQMERIAYQESLLSYAAPYVIRGVWGEKTCSLPRVNNRAKPELNVYSEQWLKIYYLCIMCRELLPEKELNQFPRAWDWLRYIVHEYRQLFLDFICSDEAKKNASKIKTAFNLQRHAMALSDYINPCDPKIEPYRHRLMEVCIEVAKKADIFRDDFWKPYLTSLKDWINVVENGSNVLAVSCSVTGNVKRTRQGTGVKTGQTQQN